MTLSLENRIREDLKQTIISRDPNNSVKKNILTVIIGEIQKETKKTSLIFVSDEDVLMIIKKTLKPINEVLNTCDPNSEFYQTSFKEKEILEEYLPQMMTEDEIRNEISNIGVDNLGLVMKHFSSLNADKGIVRMIFENEFKK